MCFRSSENLVMASCINKYDLEDPEEFEELQRMKFEHDEADLQDEIDD